MSAPVYLDHNATTPVDPGVLEAMLPYLRGNSGFGNASSRHSYGREARRAIDQARQQVAAAVGAHPTEVVFASGGSEANNLFLKGVTSCMRLGTQAPVVAISAVEHPCVREAARDLVRAQPAWTLHEIAVDARGRVDAADYARILALRPRVLSVMLANNETGVLQSVAQLAQQAAPSGAWFHTDAVQALGKLELNFRELNAAGVHAMTLSAHKIHGPKGAGALVRDKRVELRPLISGGGQEGGLRSGTENVAAIVGFGRACELAVERLTVSRERLLGLRSDLERGLLRMGATVFALGAERLPNTTYFALPEIDGETLVGKLDQAGFAVASGAACSSVSPEPSHVLQAMGVAPEFARGAIRVSFGGDNTSEQAKAFLAVLDKTVAGLQRMTALAV